MPTGPYSDAFAAALLSSWHRAVTRVTVVSLGGQELATLHPDGGQVTAAYNQPVRRSLQMSIAATPDLIPRGGGDLLDPYSGNEIWVDRGIQYRDGTQEWFPQGRFVLTASPLSEDGKTIQIAGVDRSERISTQPWIYPHQTPAGPLNDALTDLFTDRWSDVQLDLDDNDVTVNSQFYRGGSGSNPMQDGVKLALDGGYDVGFTAAGVLRSRPVPDPSTATPLFTYGRSSATHLFTDHSRPRSREGVRNGVVVVVENPVNAARYIGEAWDNNPASPYYSGPGSALGKRPEFYEAPAVTSDAGATAAAQARLRKLIGRGDEITISIKPNPALDVADVIAVPPTRDSDDAINVFIDQLTMPLLASEEERLTCRTVVPLEDVG